MKKIKTNFKDLFVIKGDKFSDKRGYFRELLVEKLIKKKLIFHVVSSTKKKFLRGLHLQRKKGQGKYLSVIKGRIFDVAIDCRKKSKTFGKYVGVKISDKDDFSFYIPEGFAHGFMCLSKECTVNYKCSKYRNSGSEKTLKWDDAIVNIKWPIKKPFLSNKDKNLGLSLMEFFNLK